MCQSPYSLGKLLHLHTFPTTHSAASNTSRLLIFAGFLCFGKHATICSYCSFCKFIPLLEKIEEGSAGPAGTTAKSDASDFPADTLGSAVDRGRTWSIRGWFEEGHCQTSGYRLEGPALLCVLNIFQEKAKRSSHSERALYLRPFNIFIIIFLSLVGTFLKISTASSIVWLFCFAVRWYWRWRILPTECLDQLLYKRYGLPQHRQQHDFASPHLLPPSTRPMPLSLAVDERTVLHHVD